MTTNTTRKSIFHDAINYVPQVTETVTVNYKTDPDCPRCKTDKYVPHYNCLYHGNAMGHSAAHCTADACY